MPAASPLPTTGAVLPAESAPRRRAGRLPRRADFLRIQAGGRKQVMPGFILQIGDRPAAIGPAGDPRVGFTVTKRIGNAVVRNRVRRRLRALAREVLVPIGRADLDYVLIGRQDAVHRAYATMADDLRRALRRLKAAEAPPERPA